MWWTVWVSVAAGFGSVARYTLDQAVRRRRPGFPYGTLLINVSGSFLLGLVGGLSLDHGLASGAALVLGAGFLGGFTTLSTWAWESLELAAQGQRDLASANVVGSIAAGLLAALAGFWLTLS